MLAKQSLANLVQSILQSSEFLHKIRVFFINTISVPGLHSCLFRLLHGNATGMKATFVYVEAYKYSVSEMVECFWVHICKGKLQSNKGKSHDKHKQNIK